MACKQPAFVIQDLLPARADEVISDCPTGTLHESKMALRQAGIYTGAFIRAKNCRSPITASNEN
jgi:hypothetical protein